MFRKESHGKSMAIPVDLRKRGAGGETPPAEKKSKRN